MTLEESRLAKIDLSLGELDADMFRRGYINVIISVITNINQFPLAK